MIYTVTDWLGHGLYSFATEQEAVEYIRRCDPHPGTVAGMSIVRQKQRPYHRVVELLSDGRAAEQQRLCAAIRDHTGNGGRE